MHSCEDIISHKLVDPAYKLCVDPLPLTFVHILKQRHATALANQQEITMSRAKGTAIYKVVTLMCG